MNVPAWVYKSHAAGDISAEELENLEKFASSISETGRAGAAATVSDPKNNLHQVMKSVPPEDRDDVLRALRQMKKQASSYDDNQDAILREYFGSDQEVIDRAKFSTRRALGNAGIYGLGSAAVGGLLGGREGAAALGTAGAIVGGLHEMQAAPAYEKEMYRRGLHMKQAAAAFTPEEYKQTMDWYRQKLKSNPNNKAMRADYESLRKHKSSLVKSASNCGTGHSNTKKRLKKMTKKASDPMSGLRAGAIISGMALAPVAGRLVGSVIDRFTRKSKAEIQNDLRRVLQVHPDIGRPEDPRVQMAYNSLVRLNPSYAEDPLIAGPLLKQIVDSRMDPSDPSSAPYVDPGMATQLTQSYKTLSDIRRPSLGSDIGAGVGKGIVQTVPGLID